MRIFTSARPGGSKSQRRRIRKMIYCLVSIAANGIMDAGQACELISCLDTVISLYARHLYRSHILLLFKTAGNENDTETFKISCGMEDNNSPDPAADAP